MWIKVVFGALVVIAVGVYIVSRSRYYRRMFSEAGFREFYSGLSAAIEVAKGKGADGEPRLDDGSAFRTAAGLGVCVTCYTNDNGSQSLHISLSQTEGPTTHGVCSGYGFFTMAMLRENKAELVPYFTKSGVHHLDFRFQSLDLKVLDFDAVYSVYLAEYRPIPFEYLEIGSESMHAADG